MRLERMRIATRLRLGFALMVLLMVVLSAVGLVSMAQNQQRMDNITRVNNVKVKLAAAMRDTVYERMVAMRDMALVNDVAAMRNNDVATNSEAESASLNVARFD